MAHRSITIVRPVTTSSKPSAPAFNLGTPIDTLDFASGLLIVRVYSATKPDSAKAR